VVTTGLMQHYALLADARLRTEQTRPDTAWQYQSAAAYRSAAGSLPLVQHPLKTSSKEPELTDDAMHERAGS